jgi:hypothetical protein
MIRLVDTIAEGDLLVLVKAAATADAGSIIAVDYDLLLEKVTAGHTWRVYTRLATAADAGTSSPSGAGTPGPGPAIATLSFVVRGGVPSAPLVETLAAAAIDWSSATAHVIAGAACSQATDLRITTWWIAGAPALTPPAGAHDTLLANASIGAAGVVAAVATDYTALGAAENQDCTSSTAQTGTGLSFALRTGVVVNVAGVTDPDPGRIGLTP